MPTFSQFDVVVVPFPYTDQQTTRKRPALIISGANNFDRRIGQSVMAMITSAAHSSWPLDVHIGDLASAGLPAPSLVRFKLFTLDHRLVIRRCGSLAAADQQHVLKAVRTLFQS